MLWIGWMMLLQFLSPPQAEQDFKAVMLREVNAMRTAGCQCGDVKMPPVAPVHWNDTLAQAAQRHADDLLRNDFFSHTGSDGSSSSSRIREAGYDFTASGENIAEAATIERVVVLWKTSPPHCKNMMQPRFEHIGLARAGNFWVLDFGAVKK